jgi:DNA-binding transcriptional MerR regulator
MIWYTITKVAEMLGIATSKIRFWESELGKLHTKRVKNVRASGDDRRFTILDIQRIRTIKALTEKQGYKLNVINKRLEELDFPMAK